MPMWVAIAEAKRTDTVNRVYTMNSDVGEELWAADNLTLGLSLGGFI